MNAQIKNSRGQATIEMVLMTVVIVATALTVSSAFRNNEFFANLVSTPWKALAGLIQNGAWGTPTDTMAKHPNGELRLNTVRGDDLQ
jgi:hypothetical protein